MTIIDNLKWRYATAKFDTNKQLPETDLEFILEAGNLAATAYGLQPFNIVVVTDEAKKQALVEHAYGQPHVAENSALIVIAAKTDLDEKYIAEYTKLIETTRGMPEGSADGYKEVMVGDLTNRTPEARLVWAQLQAYIALGTMMAAASEIKVDNHAMSGFDPSKFNEVLGLAEYNLHSTVLLALGYRSDADETQHRAKVRKALTDLVIRI